MARRKNDSNLVLIEAIGGLVAVGSGLVYLLDPAAGRALFQLVPWLILTLLVGAAVWLFFLFRSFPFVDIDATAVVTNDFPRRGSASPRDIAQRKFPKVEADRVRERIVTLEEKLDRLDWFQFEKVVAMLYSARGCRVERRGGAKPDGGIDLVIESGDSSSGIQCKYWKASEVGVRQVRELMGALQDARIPKGVIVSMKGFTDPARELAGRNRIELLGRSDVVQMLYQTRFTPHIRELRALMDSDEKYCPRCESLMVQRTSRKDGSKFWGCSGYSRGCRYTMQIGPG